MADLLSVLTPVYNGEAYLVRSYQSLAAQTFDDWEWVIVDDGSTDSTSEVCRELARRDPRVRVHHHAPNGGRGYARTRALALARGNWSVLHDVDDIYMPRRLALIDAARRDGADFFCSYALIVNNALEIKGVRGFFSFLGLRTFVHATLGYRTDLARAIGYESEIRTVGQIGEDHRMGLVLPARHRGCYHPDALMINQEDREVFLRKAIDSNGVRLRVLRELIEEGLFPATRSVCRRELRKLRLKLGVLNLMRVHPRSYLQTVRSRSYGEVHDGFTLCQDDLDLLAAMRIAFPPSDPRGLRAPRTRVVVRPLADSPRDPAPAAR